MPSASASPDAASATGGCTRRRVWWLAGLLLGLHFVLAVGSKLHESTTSDELAHLTAGVSYWLNHDYRLQPENGILPQRWAALPVALAGPQFPGLAGNPYWRTSDVWNLGHQFFYETGEDHFPRLMAGRAMIGLFSVATGTLVFLWARRLFGDAAGLVALGFFTFSPDFLAHGALVTSDVCMTFFFLAAVGAWWWHLHDGRARVWWLSALVFGLACVAKYSAVLLVPMFAGLAAVRALRPEPLVFAGRKFDGVASRLAAALLSALGHGLVAVAVIWACYGFRYSAFNPELPPATQFIRPWSFMEAHSGAAGAAIHAIASAHLLPEAWLYGLAYVIATTDGRSAFLNGAYSLTGWPTFFAWTFALKTTLAVLAASLLVVASATRRWWTQRCLGRDLYRLAPLVVLFAVYWAVSLSSHLNIGHRHILPIYPPLFIALGALARPIATGRRLQAALLGVFLGWHAFSSLRITPHFLAYFNELAGGPRAGWRHLVDSSLDWGQDLPGLKRWLDAHPSARPVYLSYFGTGEPGYYRLPVRRLPFANNFLFAPDYEPLEAGTYCVSATMLAHVYSAVRGATWTLALEREYQDLRVLEPLFARYTSHPEDRPALERDATRDKWHQGIARFELLRFARLCHYLRVRPPDAQVGYSIFIHQLDSAEIAAATAGSLDDWRRLIERTVAPSP